MSHDPAQRAAAYLAGELDASERERFEGHLMSCEECWIDVETARRGMLAIGQTRELAPAHVRERVRQAVRTSGQSRERKSFKRTSLAAMAAALVAAVATSVTLVAFRVRPPASDPIIAAVADYRAGRLPGSTTPSAPAPDLSSMRLTAVGAGVGHLDGMSVTGYAFRDSSGRRLVIYTAAKAFTMPEGGHHLDGSKGAWMAHRDGTAVLGALYPHEMLIVGSDDGLVHGAALALNVM